MARTKKKAEPVAEVIQAAESTEVAVVEIPKETAIAVFTADNGLDPYIEQIRREVAGFSADVSTRKGREAVASMAHKIARSKTYLDGCGKDLVAELKAIPAKIDAERKRMREILDSLRDQVRQPLTEWEAAEEQRIATHKTALAELEALLVIWEVDSLELQRRLDLLAALVIDETWHEFREQAQAAKERAELVLVPALEKRLAYEAEQAELEILRRQAAERAEQDRQAEAARIAQEQEQARQQAAVQAAKEQAEREARAEREAAERREQELREAAERAEREAEAARQQAEQARIAAEQAEQRAREQAEADRLAQIERDRLAAEARERDIENQRRVNVAAFEDFVNGGMPSEFARLAVTLIAKKAVRGVVINY